MSTESTNTNWREVDVGTGFEDGINFYDDFSEEILNQSLRTLHTALEQGGTPCYCLRMDVDEQRHGYFHRFGELLAPLASNMPEFSASARIDLAHLVPDLRTWSPLAIRRGVPESALAKAVVDDPQRAALLRRVSWHAAIRVQCRERYVGYIKLVGLDGAPPPDNHTLLAAAYKTKLEVVRLMAYRRVSFTRSSVEFKKRLWSTVEAIAQRSGTNPRRALHHVADMLTSHLGAGWNRAACFCPVGPNTLRCLWAQGGDGNRSWCEIVQRPLGEQVRDVEELVSRVTSNPIPVNDAYCEAASGDSPLEITHVNELWNKNILAQLWRAEGDVRKLPGEHQSWEMAETPTPPHMSRVDRQQLAKNGPVAAEFNQSDDWVQQINNDRPQDRIFTSRNGRYFAFPWRSGSQLIGIWVLDMAYWGKLVFQPDAPSLVFTAEILDALGPALDALQLN